jgi:hypothetical protein
LFQDEQWYLRQQSLDKSIFLDKILQMDNKRSLLTIDIVGYTWDRENLTIAKAG